MTTSRRERQHLLHQQVANIEERVREILKDNAVPDRDEILYLEMTYSRRPGSLLTEGDVDLLSSAFFRIETLRKRLAHRVYVAPSSYD